MNNRTCESDEKYRYSDHDDNPRGRHERLQNQAPGRREVQLGSGPFRRHQSAALPGTGLRHPLVGGEKADLLPEPSRTLRTRYLFRPKRPLQPAHPPHARSDRAGLHGRPHERGFREIRKIPEESVVRQRHTPPLFARQVPARIFRKLLRRTGRRHTRRIFSAGLHTVRCGRRGRDQAGDVRPGALPQTDEPGCRRGYDRHLGQQLLRRRDAKRGGSLLRQTDRPPRQHPHFIRSEQQAGQRGRQAGGESVESGRHVLVRDREDRLLARAGLRSG